MFSFLFNDMLANLKVERKMQEYLRVEQSGSAVPVLSICEVRNALFETQIPLVAQQPIYFAGTIHVDNSRESLFT